MNQHIKFTSIGKGYHEHRSSQWLLRIEPSGTKNNGGNAYIGSIRSRGKELLQYGPFDSATAAKAHLINLVRKQEGAS